MAGNQRARFSGLGWRVRDERGAVIIFVALGLVVLVGMLGLAFDVGHAYVNKSQLQNIADACALAGASALDGTAAGISEAEARATDYGASVYLANKTEFNTTDVTIPGSAVTYSVSLDGPWLDLGGAQAVADTIRFVRVVVPPRQTNVLFARVVPGIPDTLNFGAQAVAGLEPMTEVCGGLDPFSPIRLNPDPNNLGGFGYVIGQIYSVRLAPGSSGKNCSQYGLPGSVTGNFGLADPSDRQPSVVVFRDNILNGDYSNCVPIAGDALPADSGGGGNAILRAIQDRFDQDTNSQTYATHPDYVAGYLPRASGRNFRRIIRVAFNDELIPPGVSEPYNVVGYGCFFMAARPDAAPPSSAICLMYIGSCDISGRPTGFHEPSLTRTVLFR
jgi:hypothetical protein